MLQIEACGQHWAGVGVSETFLATHGSASAISWRCEDVCDPLETATRELADSDPSNYSTTPSELCLTCNGYPPNHGECTGVPWVQNIPDCPTALWFMIATVRQQDGLVRQC